MHPDLKICFHSLYCLCLPVCRWRCDFLPDLNADLTRQWYWFITNVNWNFLQVVKKKSPPCVCLWKQDYSLGDVNKDVFSSMRGPYESVTLRPGEVFTHPFKHWTWSRAYCPAQRHRGRTKSVPPTQSWAMSDFFLLYSSYGLYF